MNTELIRKQAELIAKQCDKIDELRKQLAWAKVPDNQFGKSFPAENERTILRLEYELIESETALSWMIKGYNLKGVAA